MASCGSLPQIFEKPFPENPTLIESLSPWNQIKSIKKPIEVSSFTEIFGELHFKDNSESSSSSLSLPPPSSSLFPPPSSTYSIFDNENLEENNNFLPSSSFLGTHKNHQYTDSFKTNSNGFSSKKSESLQLCTEGLGVESFDGIEESLMNEKKDDSDKQENKELNYNINHHHHHHHQSSKIMCQEFRRSRTSSRNFPPPISCIGRSGKPSVSFKSFRQDGRFVLKEIRIPTHEFLHACREDGRLKLHFVNPEREILEDEDEEEEETGSTEDEGNDENEEKNQVTGEQRA